MVVPWVEKYELRIFSSAISSHEGTTDNAFSEKGLMSETGWWFGTWLLFFHILGIVTDFYIFSEGLKPPTRKKDEENLPSLYGDVHKWGYCTPLSLDGL